jgi:hypothetical protein
MYVKIIIVINSLKIYLPRVISIVYNIIMCEHVYRYIGPGLCGYCGLDTHDPDWTKQNKLYAEYKEKVGYFHNVVDWWSI